MTSASLTSPFSSLVGQERVRTFLSASIESNSVSHAYLFVGAPGSGKTNAAYALASAVLCDDGGCGKCDSCIRVSRKTHPDVRYFAPAGSSGYVIDQIREIVHDTTLAPIRGCKKIYIIDRVDMLRGAPANALLKTLEEPPSDVVIILLGRTRESVMDTLLSRCQVVPFRRIPMSEAEAILGQLSGADVPQSRMALAATGGSVVKAKEYLLSTSRRAVRTEVLDILARLACSDDLDILNAAKGLLTAVKAPLADVKSTQEAQLAESSDYLTRGALRSLEERQKRELSVREREGLIELFAITRSWLRDCLTVSAGAEELLINSDVLGAIEQVAFSLNPGDITRAIGAVDKAREYISYNVSPQLTIEVMLFDIREVLTCQQ